MSTDIVVTTLDDGAATLSTPTAPRVGADARRSAVRLTHEARKCREEAALKRVAAAEMRTLADQYDADATAADATAVDLDRVATARAATELSAKVRRHASDGAAIAALRVLVARVS